MEEEDRRASPSLEGKLSTGEAVHTGSSGHLLLVEIESASYGPCEGHQLLSGKITDCTTRIPYTRDVAPFLRALLLKQAQPPGTYSSRHRHEAFIRLSGVTQTGMKRAQIPLEHLHGMNNLFGDPCPGVSKRLDITYTIGQEGCRRQKHSASFAEHEKVALWHRPSPLLDENWTSVSLPSTIPSASSISSWQLPESVSEVVLPLIMEYLSIPERVRARRICRTWRRIIRDWGVANVIQYDGPWLTRPFLRGLLQYSHQSLHILVLANFPDLEGSDLHPSIPHLRKLSSLDVSGCTQLDDTTLLLLAQHCQETLRVLYIKGLRRVTDTGILALCGKCTHLQVLDISHIPLTDASVVAVSRLSGLVALYLRDNSGLTNTSIKAIVHNCQALLQLTLWGCYFVHDLIFPVTRQTMVLLNLWGCHGLTDSTVTLEGMVSLKTLIVNECHRLTDAFFTSLADWVPQLCHLGARYCLRLTDSGLFPIARRMENLFSLDVSFCTKLSSMGIVGLLETRGACLAELRLESCRHLSIGQERDARRSQADPGSTGLAIVQTLQRMGEACCLSALDVRDCSGQRAHPNNGYASEDPFVQGMVSLGFAQRVPSYFERPARWNAAVEQRLMQ